MTKEMLLKQFEKAKNKRRPWESIWADCYHYALPHCSLFNTTNKIKSDLFDSTACDGVDQLANNLLSEMTPPWGDWFSIKTTIDDYELNETIDSSEKIIKSQINRSNFAVEIHQCYLDLVTIGTACLVIEEAPLGLSSAFRFKAVPMKNIYILENATGRPDTVFHPLNLSAEEFLTRWPNANINEQTRKNLSKNTDKMISILECVYPIIEGGIVSGYRYLVLPLEGIELVKESDGFVEDRNLTTNPFVIFRWMKTAGEVYGRSPVMKALPDIKTANMVVELVLKNANLAISGIWMADDDGVLNTANIDLKPGTIIPKAVGSQGLTPLQTATDFNVSDLVLNDLRSSIRHNLLMDKLGQLTNKTPMTATEVVERSSETARILGAMYGRLHCELLTPLLVRLADILQKRGDILPLNLNGIMSQPVYRSGLKDVRKKEDIRKMIEGIGVLDALGVPASQVLNVEKSLNFLMEKLDLPANLIDVKF